MSRLQRLKEQVFLGDNRACFIERERVLSRLNREMSGYVGEDKYAQIFSMLLEAVSTPLDEDDYFAGRVVEALPDEGMQAPQCLLWASGHMSLDYETLLRRGLGGIAEDIRVCAEQKGDAESLAFATNAAIVANAVREFAQRYADTAEQMGKARMAQALRHVPFAPAYDLYSALQSIWLIHMIASCYMGARDYAFGRFDQYLLPFYEQALAEGATESEVTELLAGFFVKTNEICGTGTWNHQEKPTLSQASKQYVNIGGDAPNVFSSVVLKAAVMNNMAQPQITVLLNPAANKQFTADVFDALAVLRDKLHIYNHEQIARGLMAKGIPEAVARDFTFSACCSIELNYHTFRMEHYAPVPQLFVKVLHDAEYESVDAILNAFRVALQQNVQEYADIVQKGYDRGTARQKFVLDSLLLSDSAARCRYPCDGEATFNLLNIFCPGLATLGDSLMVLDRLVFEEQRYTYKEFCHILASNYAGAESLRAEILKMTMFGNDTDSDRYTTMVAHACADAVDAITLKENFYAVTGFYSLERDNSWASEISATPNGRKDGEPFSENQSPTYGADKNGVTALLHSLAKIPFERAVTGGLNLTFSKPQTADVLRALVIAYFKMGGFHVGINVVDRATLEEAMKTPERYKSLTVRLYGFSEYFVSLPKWQQLAVLNRTAYSD